MGGVLERTDLKLGDLVSSWGRAEKEMMEKMRKCENESGEGRRKDRLSTIPCRMKSLETKGKKKIGIRNFVK